MNTSVNIAGVVLKNPVTTASGTFGSGLEYREMMDLNSLGAVVTKGVAPVPWAGNPAPRIAETPSGMLNAIGLQNPGIDVFISRDLPELEKYDTRVIVNVCGHAEEEYIEVVERLADQKGSICWRLIYPAPMSKPAALHSAQTPALWRRSQRILKSMPGSR